MTPELDELLALHNVPGELLPGELLFALVKLIPKYGLEMLLSQLPDIWRRALATWLTAAYDNDYSADELIHINNPGGREQMLHAKAWLGSDSAYQHELINNIDELIELFNARIFDRNDLMDQLVRISAQQGTEAIVGMLPDYLRDQFVDWARAHFLRDDVPLRRPGEKEVREWILAHESR